MKDVKTAILLTLVAVTYTEGIENTEIAERNNKGCLNVVVSFWKNDPEEKKLIILCIGALIRSNVIFSTAECSRILHPYREIAVQTGAMKLNKIDPEYILERTQELPSKSKFALVILNQHIQLLSTFNLDFIDESDYGEHDAEIVGWHYEEGPKAKPITVKVNKAMSLFPTDLNYNYVDFPSGSFVVTKSVILGFNYYNPIGKVFFYKFSIQDMSYLKKFFQGELKSNTEQERPLEIEKAEISDETYLNAIVAFYNAAHNILCIGALIKPNCIMAIKSCAQKLMPLSEIIVLTRTRYLKHNFTSTSLYHTTQLHRYSKYCLVYLFESIELLHPLEVNCMEMMNSDSMGVMVGWTEQQGPVIIRNTFLGGRYKIWTRTYSRSCDGKNHSVGSFIAKGEKIIGFVGIDDQNEITFNKVTKKDERFLKISLSRTNKDLKRVASSSEDLPSSKKSQQ